MTSKLTWIKFFPSDWLNGTRMLTPVERGVYITLIAMMYDEEGPLEDNRKLLARECNMRVDHFNAALESLLELGKLEAADGLIRNRKTASLLGERFARSETARRGGLARVEKAKQNQKGSSASAQREKSTSTAPAQQELSSSSAILEARNQIEEKRASKLAPKDQGEGQGDADLEAELRHAACWHHDAPRLALVQPIADLIARGLSLHDDVIPIIRQLAPNVETKTSWSYFLGPLEDVLKRRSTANAEKLPHDPAKPEGGKPAASRKSVIVWRDSPQGEAWTAHQTKAWPWRDLEPEGGGRRRPGWYFPTEWPPGREPNPTSKEP